MRDRPTEHSRGTGLDLRRRRGTRIRARAGWNLDSDDYYLELLQKVDKIAKDGIHDGPLPVT